MFKTLAIIAPTFMQIEGFLPAFVSCLICNIIYQNRFVTWNSNDFVAYIGHDGASIDGTKDYMNSVIESYPNNFVYFETKTRANKFGHNIRQQALEMCNEEIVMFQNVDNLICASMVKILTDIYKNENPDIIISAIAHSYVNFNYFSGIELAPNKTDFSNVTIKTSIAKQLGIDINSYAADAVFFSNLKKKFPKLIIATTSSILSVHQ